MKQLIHVERRGKWVRPDPNTPRECCVCGALSDRRMPMPAVWGDHILDGEHVFTCSTLCRLQKGLR